MPAPQVVRPPQSFFDSERFLELERYLKDHWERALTSRETQVDEKHANWQRNYEGIPAQKRRTTPWPGASNFVVQLIRMYIDTFVARTLNIIFATRPLFNLDFMPTDVKDSVEAYLNRKAIHNWDYYELTRGLLFRGAKNGTTVVKTTYEVVNEIDVKAEGEEEEILLYDGPRSSIIPFEDFYLYPITVEKLSDAVIKFHRVRYVEEQAREKLTNGKWQLALQADETVDQFLEKALQMPNDIKRNLEQEDAGVSDPWLREMQVVECELRYELEPGSGRMYAVIASLEVSQGKLLDIYYHPYVRNLNIFQDYRPVPREDLFFGDSWAQILAQAQEEASTIHNDRRNNSYIANAPIFKRKSGSLLPNPSTNWYPGKVWDLEAMDDFEVVMVGRNYNDMLAEENHVFMLAERIIGIGALQQGNASGMMGKRGIYNAAGTLAVLSESNQRQDTNIRDVRQVLGAIARTAFTLQCNYGINDPIVDMFPTKVAEQIRQGMQTHSAQHLAHSYFEIKASDAGANKEANKANLLQMAQIIGQYGNMLPQMATAILSTQNPILQQLLTETSEMHHNMAKRLLRAFDEGDMAEYLPHIADAFQRGAEAQAGGGAAPGGSQAGQAALLGGAGGAVDIPAARNGVASVAALPPIA